VKKKRHHYIPCGLDGPTKEYSMTSPYESVSHSKWDCKYHIVFIPKGRKKVLYWQPLRLLITFKPPFENQQYEKFYSVAAFEAAPILPSSSLCEDVMTFTTKIKYGEYSISSFHKYGSDLFPNGRCNSTISSPTSEKKL
jgi:hypothetical protein